MVEKPTVRSLGPTKLRKRDSRAAPPAGRGRRLALRPLASTHLPEYLMEAASLGIFMLSACTFGVLLEHPSSPIRQVVSGAFVRRLLMGVAMGSTAIAIVYSPWGKQSGAHINPAVTFTFHRLGKIDGRDAFGYILFQFLGAAAAMLVGSAIAGTLLADPSVRYVTTAPGAAGTPIAFLAELLISFLLMSVILVVSNTVRWARWTGICAGLLVATYITIEAPLSGMSMNPARTLGAALAAGTWDSLWIYFTAPPLGMLLASWLYVRFAGRARVFCAKLHHQNSRRCIFCATRGSREGVTTRNT